MERKPQNRQCSFYGQDIWGPHGRGLGVSWTPGILTYARLHLPVHVTDGSQACQWLSPDRTGRVELGRALGFPHLSSCKHPQLNSLIYGSVSETFSKFRMCFLRGVNVHVNRTEGLARPSGLVLCYTVGVGFCKFIPTLPGHVL